MRLPSGNRIVVTPLRRAAMVFSLTPPMGITMPVSVTSPVIARFGRTAFPKASDTIAVTIVHPALGPSLGVDPAGTCRCSALASKKAWASLPSAAFSNTKRRAKVCAIAEDSRITSPSWPVVLSVPPGCDCDVRAFSPSSRASSLSRFR